MRFRNPVLPGFHPDPSVCRVGRDFYLATSSFEYFPGVPLFHSRDLCHWRPIGHALTRRSQLELATAPSSGGIYAPTLRHANGRFYLITTNVSDRGNFYVSAKRPEGPWSDPIWLDRDGIDPSLCFDGETAYYTRTVIGREANHPVIHQAVLDVTTGKLRRKPRPIWAGMGGIWTEAPHLYRIGDYYYLMAAEGGTSYGHTEIIARSRKPSGPFEAFAGNPILSHVGHPRHPIQATGHADLVELADGTTWAVFLGIRPTGGRYHHLGRETFLAPVTWTRDGWPVIGRRGRVELAMDGPSLSKRVAPARAERDDFDAAKLGPLWMFLRNPNARDWSLRRRPGFLRLQGSAVTLDDVASPAFVARRQQHLGMRCRVALEFEPRHASDEAGLTVRANEAFHYDLALRRAEIPSSGAEREALLFCRVNGVTRLVARAPIDAGRVLLEIRADERRYTFRAGTGSRLRTLGELPTRDLSAERIYELTKQHFFTGACLGMYATGRGRRSSVPADFDWFEYVPGR